MNQKLTFADKKVKREGIGKNGKPYTIYEYVDHNGDAYDSFDEIELKKEVEVTVNIPDNPTWSKQVSLPRANQGGGLTQEQVEAIVDDKLKPILAKLKIPDNDLPF